jgi:hypothetical protein
MCLALLQSVSATGTVMKNDTMSLSAIMVPYYCKTVRYPEIFAAASSNHSATRDILGWGVYNTIGALIVVPVPLTSVFVKHHW